MSPVSTVATSPAEASNTATATPPAAKEAEITSEVKGLADKTEKVKSVQGTDINVSAVAVVATPANAPTVAAGTTAAVVAKDEAAKKPAGNIQNKPQPTMETEYFGPMSALMLKGSAARLAPVVKYANAHPDNMIEIDGYSDAHAEVAHSETQYKNSVKVSLQRAEAVKNYLEKLGVNANRITAKGFGNENPVATNASKEGRAQNRRSEIRFINKK